MDASQQGSLFFKLLPFEIRCKIDEDYADDYLFTTTPIDLTENDNRTHFRAGSWVSPYPPLLLTCKRLAREATSILQQYVCCMFFMSVDSWRLDLRGHTHLYAVGNFRPSLVRKLRLDICYPFDYPGEPVDHLGQDLDILFPDRVNLPVTAANIIFPNLEGIRFVQGEQESLLGRYAEFLESLRNLEKVKLRGLYHLEWLQFLKQELPRVAVEGDGQEGEGGRDLGQDDYDDGDESDENNNDDDSKDGDDASGWIGNSEDPSEEDDEQHRAGI
ncbi:hypothetical protein DL769_007127 [Monosporascus sp. CRB-8-3]|nr:hypothetical protein DL769_007127 [Monosporascus sp. CRB-8-3]